MLDPSVSSGVNGHSSGTQRPINARTVSHMVLLAAGMENSVVCYHFISLTFSKPYVKFVIYGGRGVYIKCKKSYYFIHHNYVFYKGNKNQFLKIDFVRDFLF